MYGALPPGDIALSVILKAHDALPEQNFDNNNLHITRPLYVPKQQQGLPAC